MPKKKGYNRIGEVMEAKGYTQEKLSGEANVTQRSISLYVTGQREPSLEILYRLAKALKVDPCDLLNR